MTPTHNASFNQEKMRSQVPDAIEQVFAAFRIDGNAGFHALTEFGDSTLPEELCIPTTFISQILEAAKSGDWHAVGSAFVERRFIGPTGRFALIAPYKIVRSGTEFSALSGLYGEVITTEPIQDLSASIISLIQREPEEITQILPFRCISSFGLTEGDDGEAFIVPDGWQIPCSARGPALNNVTAQDRRFSEAEWCLSRIFAESSARLLLRPLLDEDTRVETRQREFQFHEAGHSSGIGLRKKIEKDLFRTTWYRGVEEWRADGIEFELLVRHFGQVEAGRIIAANYSLRFGVDAHRQGEIERDTDVMASMLTLNSLLKTRAIHINSERKLAFIDESYPGLVRASIAHRADSLQLTRDELMLEFEQGVWGLYGSMAVDRATRVIFDGLVRLVSKDSPIKLK
jgi:hypothetical protein